MYACLHVTCIVYIVYRTNACTHDAYLQEIGMYEACIYDAWKKWGQTNKWTEILMLGVGH